MFSQTTEYALRVIVHLATLEGKPATIQQISSATKVPAGYLAKVLQSLARAGFISSQRGLHGGSVLARPVDKINVFEVIQSVSPMARIETCPLGIKSHGNKLCALHQRLDDALGMVEKALKESTMADILADKRDSRPLCEAAKPLAVTIRGKR